jgi:NAD(P)-dependent dehydrogenase (short-subunit alcohol dehydrogenase family)
MEGLSSSINKVSLDALSDSSVEQAVNSIIDKEGRIDILYNSVGGNRVGKSVETGCCVLLQ